MKRIILFTLINSIKKENMLFFLSIFSKKILSLYLYLKAVLEEKGKILQNPTILLNHIHRYNPKTTKK